MKRCINCSMLHMLDSDRQFEVIEWSAQRWADELGCSKTSVAETYIWKVILPRRRALEREIRLEARSNQD
jgi:hypothetical protein